MKLLRAYVVEPQDLFVTVLLDVLGEVSIDVVQVAAAVDIPDLLRVRPRLLFVDTDYISPEPLSSVSIIRALLPEALLCVYTNEHSPNWLIACRFAGADGIISKAASKEELQEALRTLLRTRSFTDTRFSED